MAKNACLNFCLWQSETYLHFWNPFSSAKRVTADMNEHTHEKKMGLKTVTFLLLQWLYLINQTQSLLPERTTLFK